MSSRASKLKQSYKSCGDRADATSLAWRWSVAAGSARKFARKGKLANGNQEIAWRLRHVSNEQMNVCPKLTV